MGKNFNYFSFIKTLISFSPRQLEGEKKTADFLLDYLEKNKIPYFLEPFFTKIPLIKEAVLFADGKKIPCQGTSFVSGKIKDKSNLISSLIGSKYFLTYPNINFNPKCPTISLSNFYFAPALAVDKKGLSQILKAKKVFGQVEVEAKKHRSFNILVGNKTSARNIIFAHYDSIETGATDNASGVAVVMKTILLQPQLLKNNLFVFSGNEELSYDKPTYWGHGYRVFEKKHKKILKNSKKILVLDCLGNGKTKIFKDEHTKYLAFPICDKSLKKKISVLAGNIDKLMTVYHSKADNIYQLKKNYLEEAYNLLVKKIT